MGFDTMEGIVGVGVGVAVLVGFGEDLAEVVVSPSCGLVSGIFEGGDLGGFAEVGVGEDLVFGVGGGDGATKSIEGG